MLSLDNRVCWTDDDDGCCHLTIGFVGLMMMMDVVT